MSDPEDKGWKKPDGQFDQEFLDYIHQKWRHAMATKNKRRREQLIKDQQIAIAEYQNWERYLKGKKDEVK
jgi:hypothetical protein